MRACGGHTGGEFQFPIGFYRYYVRNHSTAGTDHDGGTYLQPHYKLGSASLRKHFLASVIVVAAANIFDFSFLRAAER